MIEIRWQGVGDERRMEGEYHGGGEGSGKAAEETPDDDEQQDAADGKEERAREKAERLDGRLVEAETERKGREEIIVQRRPDVTCSYGIAGVGVEQRD